jgi:hypothetical protein
MLRNEFSLPSFPISVIILDFGNGVGEDEERKIKIRISF